MVGVFGDVGQKEINYFRDALVADSVRGYHSTGVASIIHDRKNKDYKCWYYKEVVTGAEAVTDKTYKSVYDDKANIAIVGHNRWATAGKVNKDNAHPFTHKHITLMHNGTLHDTQGLKGNHDTDSEQICDTFSQSEDIVEVLEALFGAFALVWFNTADNTLNFAKNEDRPLFFIRNKKKNTLYYASELKMIEWCMERNKIPLVDAEVLELPAGEWWSYQIDDMGSLKELEPTITRFDPTSYYSPYYNSYVPQVQKRPYQTGDSVSFKVISIEDARYAKKSCSITGVTTADDGSLCRVRGYSVPLASLPLVQVGDKVKAEVSGCSPSYDKEYAMELYLKGNGFFELEPKEETEEVATIECDNCQRYVTVEECEDWYHQQGYTVCNDCNEYLKGE